VFGGGSIQLARIFGIRIGANPSWFFVLFLLIYIMTGRFGDIVEGSNSQAFALGVAAALLFFVSLTLHELGHAIVARRNGIGIAGIDLFFFGGIAKITREADTPGAEFRIAAAGPAVTALVVVVCAGLAIVLGDGSEFVDSATFQNNVTSAGVALLAWLAAINAVLLVFNLVPAFPLDGGRIARAAAWRITGDRNRGTRFSGRAGQLFAYILIGYGIYLLMTSDSFSGIYTIVLGFFLNQAARGAVLSSAFSERLGGITVADVMDAAPVSARVICSTVTTPQRTPSASTARRAPSSRRPGRPRSASSDWSRPMRKRSGSASTSSCTATAGCPVPIARSTCSRRTTPR